MAGIRSRWASSTRLGAANLLTAPSDLAPYSLLRGEGLTQLLLLLLGQVGRDDLVRRRRPAGQSKQSRGSLCYLLANLLDEVVADAHVGHRTRAHGRTDRRAKEGHEEDQSEQESPESATQST